MKKTTTIIILLTLIASCASVGKKLTEKDMQGFVAGETTLRDVVARLGIPNDSGINRDGSRIIVYSHATADFIGNVEAGAASITFNADGTLKSYNLNPTGQTGKQALSEKPATPDWQPLIEGSDLMVNVNWKYHPSEMQLSNNTLLRGHEWDGHLKAFVESLSPDKRDTALKGLTVCDTKYDNVEKTIRFMPPRLLSGIYSRTSYVALSGNIKDGSVNALLRVKYYGESWVFAERITVVADDFTWRSGQLKFYRDNYGGNVWESAYLDISKQKNRDLANKIATAGTATIRFHGKQYYTDLIVPKKMQADLRAMLQAVDAVNGS